MAYDCQVFTKDSTRTTCYYDPNVGGIWHEYVFSWKHHEYVGDVDVPACNMENIDVLPGLEYDWAGKAITTDWELVTFASFCNRHPVIQRTRAEPKEGEKRTRPEKEPDPDKKFVESHRKEFPWHIMDCRGSYELYDTCRVLLLRVKGCQSCQFLDLVIGGGLAPPITPFCFSKAGGASPPHTPSP